MKNIFSNYNSTFCLLQQINMESDEKYFIFGIKFDDIFIPDNIEFKDNKVKIFIIEKTFLFISNEPLFKLFENIVNFILVYKKVIFQNLIEFKSLLDKNIVSQFNEQNNENVRIIFNKLIIYLQNDNIKKILDYIYKKNFPRPNEYFSYICPINKIPFSYNFPSKYELTFLGIESLGPIIFKLLNPDLILELIYKILSEQSLIIISDELENLTALV